MSPEARSVLAECLKRQRAVAARPKPPAWKTWEAAADADERQDGPRYAPADWFGGERAHLPERNRVRFLRAVYALADAGLVVVTKTGGRLTNLKVTPAGEAALAAAADGGS